MDRNGVVDLFFKGNFELADDVQLTEEEIELFKDFEAKELRRSGMWNLSGSYSELTVIDYDCVKDGGIYLLFCQLTVGIQEEGYKSEETWDITYDRKEKTFKNEAID